MLAALEQLFSEKVLCLARLYLSWSFGYREQASGGFVLSILVGVSGLPASLPPNL